MVILCLAFEETINLFSLQQSVSSLLRVKIQVSTRQDVIQRHC